MRSKGLLLPTRLPIFVSLFIATLTFIPSFLSHRHQASDLEDLKPFVHSTLTIHTSLGAIGCCLSFLFHEFFHLPLLRKDITIATRTPQKIILLLSILIPATVIYVTSLTNSRSLVLYLCSTNTQEILYFCGFMTYYSSFLQCQRMRFLSFGSHLLFSIGFLISSWTAADAANSVGFYFSFSGFVGFIALSICRIRKDATPLPDAATPQPLKDRAVSILFFANLLFRIVLYFLVKKTARSLRHATISQYLLVGNTLTILTIFTISSVELTDELSTTKLRFEAKRNFIRHLSHEMRTPLNCVLVGLEIALSQMKEKNMSRPNPSSLPFPPSKSERPRPAPFMHSHSPQVCLTQNSCPKDDGSILLEILESTFLSCQTAIELLNDSLSYDKLEAQEMQLNLSKVPIRTLIERCVNPFLIQAAQLNISLNYQSSSPLGDTFVAVDFNRFSQVLRNIISNALKFTSPGGVIDVRVTEQTAALTSESILNFDQARFPKEDTHTDYIRIDISDTGSGMTKTQQESLFRGPVQFADSSAANANGAGLGLWISKSIVDLHGGFLFVSSDGIPGRGCVFTILLRKDRLSLDLPLFTPSTSLVATVPQQDIDDLEANLKFSSQEKEPPPEGFSKTNRIFPIEESPKSQKSLRESDGFTRSVPCVQPPDVAGLTSIAANPFPRVALCVDDSSMSRKVIGKYLEHHFEVLYAVDGLNAVEVVKNSLTEGHSTIDIIFMDNFMPLMDGLKATHQIRELGFRGPIVGITGNCEPDQIDDFIEQGATTVIEKPIQLNFFRKVILDVMGSNSPRSLIGK